MKEKVLTGLPWKKLRRSMSQLTPGRSIEPEWWGLFDPDGATTSSLTPSQVPNGHLSLCFSARRVVLPVTHVQPKACSPGGARTRALFDNQVEELNAKTGLGSHENGGFCGVIGLELNRRQPIVVAFTILPPTSLTVVHSYSVV